MLNNSSIEHCERHEYEPYRDPQDGLKWNLAALEARVQPVLNQRPKYNASNGICDRHHIVGNPACIHLSCLGHKVVLHLVEANVEHDKWEPIGS